MIESFAKDYITSSLWEYLWYCLEFCGNFKEPRESLFNKFSSVSIKNTVTGSNRRVRTLASWKWLCTLSSQRRLRWLTAKEIYENRRIFFLEDLRATFYCNLLNRWVISLHTILIIFGVDNCVKCYRLPLCGVCW